jgi:hypothetical protein
VDIPATSDNIPGTLVLRDASGNLSANVTGNLTGTASAVADNTVTSAKIVDGTIVDADISASAAIGKTKISGIAITAADSGTVTSAMIADGAIVDADINSSAAIGLTKLAAGALPNAITVSSTNLVDGTIVNADISASASIAHTKLASVTSGNVIIGNASNAATSTAVTGDVTISNTGVTTIANGVVIPAKLSQPLTLGTAKSATGPDIDFTGIPSWVKRITVMFDSVSTNGSSRVMVQLGDAGGFEETDYIASCTAVTEGSAISGAPITTGFPIAYGSDGTARTGAMIITHMGGNKWVAQGVFTNNGISSTSQVAGVKTLSGTLTQVRVTAFNGTDTFDATPSAGSVNVMYEG